MSWRRLKQTFLFSFYILVYLIVSSNDCSVEARLSDTFRIKKAEFDSVIIVREDKRFSLVISFSFSIQHDQVFMYFFISIVIASRIFLLIIA